MVEWGRWWKEIRYNGKSEYIGICASKLFFSKGLWFVFCDQKIIFRISHKIDCSKFAGKAIWFWIIQIDCVSVENFPDSVYMKKMFNKIEEEGNNALKEIIEYKSFKCLSHAWFGEIQFLFEVMNLV